VCVYTRIFSRKKREGRKWQGKWQAGSRRKSNEKTMKMMTEAMMRIANKSEMKE